MYTISFNWKSFKVDLADFDLWLRSNTEHYIGMSANSRCEIHFSEAPSSNIQDRVHQQWESFNEENEAVKVKHRENLEKAVHAAKENLPYAEFTQLIVAEKKLWMGQTLTLQDKEDLLAKFPQA